MVLEVGAQVVELDGLQRERGRKRERGGEERERGGRAREMISIAVARLVASQTESHVRNIHEVYDEGVDRWPSIV